MVSGKDGCIGFDNARQVEPEHEPEHDREPEPDTGQVNAHTLVESTHAHWKCCSTLTMRVWLNLNLTEGTMAMMKTMGFVLVLMVPEDVLDKLDNVLVLMVLDVGLLYRRTMGL